MSTHQPATPQQASRKLAAAGRHTAPDFPASMDMPQHFPDLYPQATPDMNDAMTATDARMSLPASGPAGPLMAAAAGSEVVR
ncbi:hypothetical protein OG267_40755 (plasmid) [Kitasatospora herbaricolor]|uniref:hypothetical protein n=1 Tax=Kitasatospora herbaricolor TaxID=68217 RepID=UPI002E338ECC|nr:hypothetical protein [Kitasatospora herbaricolor]